MGCVGTKHMKDQKSFDSCMEQLDKDFQSNTGLIAFKSLHHEDIVKHLTMKHGNINLATCSPEHLQNNPEAIEDI